MPDLSITSLRGGMNNTDPAIAIPEDQCVLARNTEIVESMLGERRLGTEAIDLPAIISARDRVPFVYRHLPTADEGEAELIVLGVTSTTTAKLARKTSSWSEVTISDTPVLTGFGQYRWQAVTLHGKLHLFYPSNVDRPHVMTADGTMRRSGFTDTTTAPTAADSGGAGTLAGTRYGRVRWAEVSGSTVLRRSEPSSVRTFSPSGSNAAITWTRPTAPSEGETHWEIELSTDYDSNTDSGTFYRMARIAIGTTTHSDTVSYSTGYASTGTLSEDIGDYTPLWSARYAAADDDRLLIAGSFDDDALASRVGWTPVYNADGVGNDERIEADTDPSKDLDTYAYGPVTGLSETVLGGNWVTKQDAIYKLTRTNQRENAYDVDQFSSSIGAIHGSLVSGVDEQGQPCLYAIDRKQGPYRIGLGGIKRCGEDLRTTWKTLNKDATAVACSAIYYPDKKQVIWCIATGSSNTPDTAIVLHVDKSRSFADGIRKGWAIWTGTRAKALTMCLFASNIDDNTTRNTTLVPFIGLEGLGLVHRCDTGIDDNGVAYAGTVTTRPVTSGSLEQQFEVTSASLLGEAVSGAAVDIACVRDFGKETTVTVSDVSFTPSASETDVIAALDNLKGAEMRVAQFTISDVDSPSAQWVLNRLDLTVTKGKAA